MKPWGLILCAAAILSGSLDFCVILAVVRRECFGHVCLLSRERIQLTEQFVELTHA